MDGFAADFQRFRQSGRIGVAAPRVECVLDARWVIPGAPIMGLVNAFECRPASVSWRYRGQQVWQRAALNGNRFSLPGLAHAGIVEVRATGVGEHDGEAVSDVAAVDVHWPAAEVSARLSKDVAARHDAVQLMVNAGWVQDLHLALAGRVVRRRAAHPGAPIDVVLYAPTHDMGRFDLAIEWNSLDGQHGAQRLAYEVHPRNGTIAMRVRPQGGISYSTTHASNLRLRIPDRGIDMPIPADGVVDALFLAPATGEIEFLDEAGQRHRQALKFDYAPRGWSPLPGFSDR